MIVNFIKNNLSQIIRFGIIGLFNTCSSLIIYYVLLYLDFNYLLANLIAYFVSCFISYRFNKDFVFKSVYGNKVKYYLVYGSSFVINMVCIYIWIEVLNITKEIAPIITLCITVPYNYLFSKFWTFDNKKSNYSHTFVICCYKECKYLEDCILSLFNQSIISNIIMVTSTDNEFIRKLAKKYKIKLYIRRGRSDIQRDWNFAYSKADSDLVTIVHQDDVYESNYLEEIMNFYANNNDVLFACTDYYILKNGKREEDINGKLKKVLKFPLRFSLFNSLKFFKVGALAFGNSINCPSVTYNKLLLGKNNIFTSKLKFSLDWDTFLKFAKKKGRIGYISKKLICYRIHQEATTVLFITNDERYNEDVIMFLKIWPKFIVKIIMKFYVKASKIYDGCCE